MHISGKVLRKLLNWILIVSEGESAVNVASKSNNTLMTDTCVMFICGKNAYRNRCNNDSKKNFTVFTVSKVMTK